jgi:hemin uptake protein HemP
MISSATEYQLLGITLNPDTNELKIDLAQPRSILVRGINERTLETKDYLLKVTNAGRLILQ